MRLVSPRVLLLSVAGGTLAGVAGGLAFAWLAGKLVMYGIGTGLLLAAVTAGAAGAFGAIEPPAGWAGRAGGRRGLLARLATEDDVEPSAGAMALWGAIVGGILFALAAAAYSFAA